MKYRFKIDTPWGKKGQFVNRQTSDGFFVIDDTYPRWVCVMSAFPDMFEPIPEVDPVKKVAKWLEQKFLYYESPKLTGNSYYSVSKSLIAAGLDPNKLEDK